MDVERVVLASASPRRAELLREIFEEFEIIPSFADDRTDETSPEKAAVDLAAKKAREIFERLKSREAVNKKGLLVIACDTVVCLDGKFLGKPKDASEAFETLKKLNGRAHEVYSGVCIIYDPKEEFGEKTERCTETRFFDVSRVFFKDNSDAEIREYIETFAPFDKAGAYGIQDGRLVEGYEGRYKNIVGLPVERIKKELKILKDDA
jgi:septum formation protein